MMSTIDTIIQRINESFFACWLDFGRLPFAKIIQSDAAVMLLTGLREPLLNAVIFSQFAPESAVEEAKQRLSVFRDAGLPFSWYVGPYSTPPNFDRYLLSEGLTFSDRSIGMALRLGTIRKILSATIPIQIEVVESSSHLRTWSRIFMEGYGASEAFSGAMLELYLMEDNSEIGGIHYWAWSGGLPVATLTLVIGNEGIASIYDVATIPTHRRQGIGRAIVQRALKDATELGCELAVLQSTMDGYSLYSSLGFTSYCHYDCYTSMP